MPARFDPFREAHTNPVISVRNLTKRYGEVLAVQDVTFDVAEGEVMGFLGPNGAGKSTTIRILTGYLPATAGTVQVAGLDVLSDSLAIRQKLGYLPENVPLYPELRVEEYLRYRGRLKGLTARNVKAGVERVMDQCGLMHVRQRIVGQLSKGYRQRVGLADSMVAQPRLLILDEPTGGLDPHQRKEVLDLIRGLAHDHTVLLSSHILAEIESISTRVMIIQKGRLLANGRMDELAERLQDAPAVAVEVKARRDVLLQALAPILRQCGEACDVADLADGWVRATLRPPVGSDQREAIAAALRGANLPMRELHRHQRTLEELFLHITAQAAQRTGEELAAAQAAAHAAAPSAGAAEGAR
ncbi:MAG: ABC transporter ATP-binding protein [Planctomycetes bacterium]|nr:ABC transporter ATP-binding protein [Planctomycetota bacterium]